jgi:hypothetical protein
VETSGGRLGLVTLEAALIGRYGCVPARGELDADCRRHELRLESSAVISRESMNDSLAALPAPDVDLSGRVKGIPAAARQHFDELLRASGEPALELLERARVHLGAIEDAGRHNEFIDVALARRLVALSSGSSSTFPDCPRPSSASLAPRCSTSSAPPMQNTTSSSPASMTTRQ